MGALTLAYTPIQTSSNTTARPAAAACTPCPASAANTALTAAAAKPTTPGSGMRRSPKRCTLPTTATSTRSSTRASAGRSTIAQKTSVPYTTAVLRTAMSAVALMKESETMAEGLSIAVASDANPTPPRCQ
jgi:hypothetical protein